MQTLQTGRDASVSRRVVSAMTAVHLVRALLLVGLATAAPTLDAQEMRTLERRPEMEIWGGLAQGSPQLGILGETPGMNVAMVGLRIARPLSRVEHIADSRRTLIHLDIIPFALMSPPYVSLAPDEADDCSPGSLCLQPGTSAPGLFPNGSAIGIGMAPLGITTQFRRDRRLSPSFGLTGGALVFDRPVPTTRGTQFNFTAAIEVGLRVGLPERSGFILTYRFHHISNAGTARENPGVASHLFTFGLGSGRAP
jgi:hypothetical protein